MSTARPPILRRDLLLRLMLPLLAIVAATGGLGYLTALRMTDSVFDGWLLDDAQSLAMLVDFVGDEARIDLPPAAAAVVVYDAIDRTLFCVHQGPRRLAGQCPLPEQGSTAREYPLGRAFDATLADAGVPVRLAVTTVVHGSSAPVELQVAETTVKRQRARRELAWILLPIVGVLLGGTALAITAAVRSTVKPLERIAARWNTHSRASLKPVPVGDVPDELLPFASALNRLLSRVRETLQREREFSASVAHQLRTPITSLALGLARAREAGDLHECRAVLAELERTTQHCGRLIRQLLALGKVDARARREIMFAETDLVAMAGEVGSTFLDAAQRRGIQLELSSAQRRVMRSVNAELLGEALANLIDNALRYTPRGGQALIEVEAEPPALRVSDSGPGIADAERDVVTQRFVRGSHAVAEGSGLGLAIVADIAELHGARLTLGASRWGGLSAALVFAGRAPT